MYLGAGRKMGQLGKNLPIRVVRCEEQSMEMVETPTRLSSTITKIVCANIFLPFKCMPIKANMHHRVSGTV